MRRGWISSVVAGGVVGVVEVLLLISFAALIFTGEMAPFLPAGIGLLLASGTLITGLVAALSPTRVMIAIPQDTVAAVTAVMAASIADRFRSGSREALLTLVGAMAVTAILSGAVYLVLGASRLGDLVRYIPYPVIGGFLAGTGWLLVRGGLDVSAGVSVGMTTLDEIFSPDRLARWVPALALAAGLMLLVARTRHFLVLPLAFIGSIALAHLVIALTGAGIGEAESGGWLLGPLPEGGLWEPLVAEAITGADLGAVVGQLGNGATLLFVALVALLLNASGVEVTVKGDVDLNRELRAAGIANVVSGLTGGISGYQTLSLSVLGHRIAGPSRAVGLTAAGVCAIALLAGTAFIGIFPRAVVGGMLMFLGLGFLIDWLWEGRRRLTPADYAIVVIILGVIGIFGFLQGVGVGLAAALVLFVFNYSRTPLVTHSLSGATFHSRVQRPPAHRRILADLGGRLAIFRLQGYMFFGTANRLSDRIRVALGAGSAPRIRYVLLDLERVTGVDPSALMSFHKMADVAESEGGTVVLTGIDADLRARLERSGLVAGTRPVWFAVDLDHGVEWCEERILEDAHAGAPSEEAADGSVLGRIDLERMRPFLEEVPLRTGDHLIRQGEAADCMFFIHAGIMRVELELPDGSVRRLNRVLPGTVLGEVGLYRGGTRVSSVVAECDALAYRLTAERLAEMRARRPALAADLHRAIAASTAERLADLIQAVEDMLH